MTTLDMLLDPSVLAYLAAAVAVLLWIGVVVVEYRAQARRHAIRAEMARMDQAPEIRLRPADYGTPMFLVDELQVDTSLEDEGVH